jgi:hypothetical protein
MTNADKANIFCILTFVLIGIRYNNSIFYNLAIGISLGACMFYHFKLWFKR